MFREHWQDLEDRLGDKAVDLRNKFFDGVQSLLNRNKAEDSQVEMSRDDLRSNKEAFIKWGKAYVDDLKEKADSERAKKAKEDFFVLLRNLGINDELVRHTFKQNQKEIFDSLVGELVAVVSLVLGWKEKDKEQFSQALGEIGVIGVFAAKPFVFLIAICGLAYGYQENFHGESFKKGGVLGLAGMAAAALSPGGFVGLLAAIVTIVYLNKKLKVDRPIEMQVKQIFKEIKDGKFVKEVRQSWHQFEDFLSNLFQFTKKRSSEKGMTVGEGTT